MLIVALVAAMAVLIILEKTKVINISNMGASIFMMCTTCLITGLYVFDSVNAVIALLVNVFGFDEKNKSNLKALVPSFKDMSTVSVVVKFAVLLVLSIPFALGTVYIIQHMVRKPVTKEFNESDDAYFNRCGIRSLTLAVAAMVFSIIAVLVLTICSLPYILETALTLNPLFLFIAIAFLWLAGVCWAIAKFVIINAPLMMTLICTGTIAFSFYVFSAIMGIAACVRARKAGILNTRHAVCYGIFSLLPCWNIVAFVLIRSQFKKAQKNLTYGQPF